MSTPERLQDRSDIFLQSAPKEVLLSSDTSHATNGDSALIMTPLESIKSFSLTQSPQEVILIGGKETTLQFISAIRTVLLNPNMFSPDAMSMIKDIFKYQQFKFLGSAVNGSLTSEQDFQIFFQIFHSKTELDNGQKLFEQLSTNFDRENKPWDHTDKELTTSALKASQSTVESLDYILTNIEELSLLMEPTNQKQLLEKIQLLCTQNDMKIGAVADGADYSFDDELAGKYMMLGILQELSKLTDVSNNAKLLRNLAKSILNGTNALELFKCCSPDILLGSTASICIRQKGEETDTIIGAQANDTMIFILDKNGEYTSVTVPTQLNEDRKRRDSRSEPNNFLPRLNFLMGNRIDTFEEPQTFSRSISHEDRELIVSDWWLKLIQYLPANILAEEELAYQKELVDTESKETLRKKYIGKMFGYVMNYGYDNVNNRFDLNKLYQTFFELNQDSRGSVDDATVVFI